MDSLKCVLCCGMIFDSTTSLLNHVEHYLQSVYQCPICCVQVHGIEEIRSHLQVHCNEENEICDRKLEINSKAVIGQSSEQQFSGVTFEETSLSDCVGIADCNVIPAENIKKKCDLPCESKMGRTAKVLEDNLNILFKEVCDTGSIASEGMDFQGVQDVAKETENCQLTMRASVTKRGQHSKGKDNMYKDGKHLAISTKKILHHRCPVCSCIIIHSLYRKHLWEHQNKKEKFPCEKCGKKYKHFKSFEQHIAAMHNGRQGFTCEICGKFFESQQGINLHRLKHEEKRNYACNKCDKKFYQYSTLKDHMYTHNEKKLKCPMCGNYFKSNKSLANHIRNLHNSSDRCFCCHTCGLTFKSNYNFRDHMSVHSSDSGFRCKFCDKSFTKYTSKYQHERRLHSDREVGLYVCELCDRQFKSKSSHAHHIKMHKGVKDHQCLDCLQKFATKDNLKKHVLIHQGVKPFRCEKCSKDFRQKTTYISHLRLHTGEKPFECCTCGKKFRHRATLRKHQCYGVQLINCNTCGKSFSAELNFKNHECCKADEGNQKNIHSKVGLEKRNSSPLLSVETDNILIIDETCNSEAVAIQDFLMLNLENNIPSTTAVQERILTLQLQDVSTSVSVISNRLEGEKDVAATVARNVPLNCDIQIERNATSFTDE